MVELTERAGTLLLGRRTYEIFASHWPLIGDEDPIARKLNAMPKVVASRTLEHVEWNNTTLLRGDVAREVEALKQQDGGEIQVTGSGDLIQTLLRHDLVDEFRLWTFPVVLGSGKRLFADGAAPASLRLLDARHHARRRHLRHLRARRRGRDRQLPPRLRLLGRLFATPYRGLNLAR